MPDTNDDFERALHETGIINHVDDFDALASELGVQPSDEHPAQQAGTGHGWLADLLAGGEEGLTLGNTRNLGKLGAGLATRVADAVSPSLERDGMAPQYSGERGVPDWLSSLTGAAQQSTAGKIGRALGTGVTALGAGGAAGPGVAAQAATGAALGAGSAAGESDGKLMAMLAAMPAGAAMGAAGGVVGKAANGIADNSDAIMKALRAPGIAQMVRHPVQSALTVGARTLADSPNAMNALAITARGAGQLGAATGGSLAGMVGKAQAQDPGVAYGNAPSMAWAAQSVLASGNSGLAPEDEQRLTEAMLDGDDDKVISANFAAQMKNPAYAARLQRELESLQED